MVHGLAEQSGGRFILRSRIGEGTTAELWLPVAETGARVKEIIPRAAHASESRDAPLVVIAVDDDALVLTNTVAMLEDLGHIGFAATSGREALDIIRREPSIDLVITDQAMPHMTGIQLAESIGQEWPDLPVIIATGYAEIPPGSGLDLRKLGKPFTQEQLADEVARAVPPNRRSARVVPLRANAK
jgi:CheY-like chemotaxis protein